MKGYYLKFPVLQNEYVLEEIDYQEETPTLVKIDGTYYPKIRRGRDKLNHLEMGRFFANEKDLLNFIVDKKNEHARNGFMHCKYADQLNDLKYKFIMYED